MSSESSAIEVPEIKIGGKPRCLRWETISPESTLMRVECNKIRLLNKMGFTLDEQASKRDKNFEEAAITLRSYDEEMEFLTETFEPYLKYRYRRDKNSERTALTKSYSKEENGETVRLLAAYVEDNPDKPNISQADLTKLISRFAISEEDTYTYIMVISNKTLTDSSKHSLLQLEMYEYIFFEDWQLYVEPTSFYFNQTFFVLNEEQRSRLLEQLRQTKHSLPMIRSDDPNIIANGWKIGDIVMIVRKDLLSDGPEYSVYYRQIVLGIGNKLKKKK